MCIRRVSVLLCARARQSIFEGKDIDAVKVAGTQIRVSDGDSTLLAQQIVRQACRASI